MALSLYVLIVIGLFELLWFIRLHAKSESINVTTIRKEGGAAVNRIREFAEQVMFDNINDGIIVVDNFGAIITINRAAKKLLSLSRKKTPLTLAALCAEGDNSTLSIGTKHNVLLTGEYRILDKWISVTTAPLMSVTDGTSIRYGSVSILRDVTEAKDFENKREEFSALMIHELRSPLDGVKKISEFAISHPDKFIGNQKEFTDVISLIQQSSSAMLRTVTGLLEIFRSANGKLALFFLETPARNLIKEAVKKFKDEYGEKRVRFSIKIDPSVENISCDSRRIISILNHLIYNAVMHGEAKKITIGLVKHLTRKNPQDEISVIIGEELHDAAITGREMGESVLFFVKDNGQGIARELLPYIFDKFRAVRVESSGKPPLSLDSPIAKAVIEAHGGKIGVCSTEKSGTIFYFYLPVKSSSTNS